MRRPVRPSIACLALGVILVACGQPTGSASSGARPSAGAAASLAAESAAAGEPTPGTELTACQLVTAADVEAALSLAAGTVSEGALEEQPTVLDSATNECRYTDEEWGGLVVHVTPTDGVNTFDAVQSAFGDKAEVVEAGDGALWFPANLRGYFVKGSVLVLLQFTFIVEDGADFKAATISVGKAAMERI